MNQDELPGYLRRILGYCEKITECVQSMAVSSMIEERDEASKVNISEQALDKLKKIKQ